MTAILSVEREGAQSPRLKRPPSTSGATILDASNDVEWYMLISSRGSGLRFLGEVSEPKSANYQIIYDDILLFGSVSTTLGGRLNKVYLSSGRERTSAAAIDWLADPINLAKQVVRRVSSATSEAETPSSAEDVNPVLEKIREKRSSRVLEGEASKIAHAAIEDATTLFAANKIGSLPSVYIDDDGFLILQWQREKRGVALIFVGDRTASIGIAGPGQLYSDGDLEISVDGLLPQSFHDALDALQNR